MTTSVETEMLECIQMLHERLKRLEVYEGLLHKKACKHMLAQTHSEMESMHRLGRLGEAGDMLIQTRLGVDPDDNGFGPVVHPSQFAPPPPAQKPVWGNVYRPKEDPDKPSGGAYGVTQLYIKKYNDYWWYLTQVLFGRGKGVDIKFTMGSQHKAYLSSAEPSLFIHEHLRSLIGNREIVVLDATPGVGGETLPMMFMHNATIRCTQPSLGRDTKDLSTNMTFNVLQQNVDNFQKAFSAAGLEDHVAVRKVECFNMTCNEYHEKLAMDAMYDVVVVDGPWEKIETGWEDWKVRKERKKAQDDLDHDDDSDLALKSRGEMNPVEMIDWCMDNIFTGIIKKQIQVRFILLKSRFGPVRLADVLKAKFPQYMLLETEKAAPFRSSYYYHIMAHRVHTMFEWVPSGNVFMHAFGGSVTKQIKQWGERSKGGKERREVIPGIIKPDQFMPMPRSRFQKRILPMD
jgi:hypothetical protein